MEHTTNSVRRYQKHPGTAELPQIEPNTLQACSGAPPVGQFHTPNKTHVASTHPYIGAALEQDDIIRTPSPVDPILLQSNSSAFLHSLPNSNIKRAISDYSTANASQSTDAEEEQGFVLRSHRSLQANTSPQQQNNETVINPVERLKIHFTSPEANTPTIVRDLMALMETCGVFSPHYLACDISLLQNIYYRSATVAPDGKPLRILTVGPRGCGDSDIVLPLLVRIALMRYAIGPREACPLFVPLPWANLVPNDHCNACEFSENFLRGVFQALSIQVPSTAPHTSASLFGFWNHLADMGCGEEVEDAPIVPSIVPELLRPRWLSLLRNLHRSLHVDGDFKRFVSDLFLVPVLISKSFGLSGVCFVQSNFSTTARDIEIRSSSQDTHSTSTFRFAEALFPSIFPRKYRNSVHFIACWDDNGPSLSEEAEKAVETTGKLSMVPSVSNQEELASFVQFARPRILAMRHLVQGVETSIPERIVVPSHSDFTVCLADCHGYPSAVHLYFQLHKTLVGRYGVQGSEEVQSLIFHYVTVLSAMLKVSWVVHDRLFDFVQNNMLLSASTCNETTVKGGELDREQVVNSDAEQLQSNRDEPDCSQQGMDCCSQKDRSLPMETEPVRFLRFRFFIGVFIVLSVCSSVFFSNQTFMSMVFVKTP